MRDIIDIGAEAEDAGRGEGSGFGRRGRFCYEAVGDLPEHTFPGRRTGGFTTEDTGEHRENHAPHPILGESGETPMGNLQGSDLIGVEQPNGEAEDPSISGWSWEEERERRIYRGRTVKMLRRYMRYSIETGRLPSVLGREFFRAPVTPYSFVTFEDRVIFVHDMETSLNKLDEFSREIIARHILQEHDQEATARLLHCTGRTVRTYVPIALDLLSEILLDVGLLERTFPIREKSCQGGKTGEIFVSSSEESKNKF